MKNKKLKWISVNKRLPPYDKEVLTFGVYDKKKYFFAIYYIVESCPGNWYEGDNLTVTQRRNVTHWMPLTIPHPYDDVSCVPTESTLRLIEAQSKYIKMLESESSELAPLALDHGWKSSNIEKGEKLRKDILKLK